jgi:hypothetical protein
MVLCIALCFLIAGGSGAGEADVEGSVDMEKEREEGWIPLFDGKTLKGWKPAEENSDAFRVEEGKLVADGGRCHLYYVGPVSDHDFKDFELKLEVMTTKGSNSGVYFHTAYTKVGWPRKGHEAQVNSTHSDWRRTGSLYNIRDVREAHSKDDKWFTYHIIVKGQRVVIKVNGKTTVDYAEPEGLTRKDRTDGEIIGHGTFALQAHDPKSVTYYRNIRVKLNDENNPRQGS